MSTVLPEQKPGYPSGDGKPIAETGIHVMTIMWLHMTLLDFFENRPDVFIASDMFWYWEEGNPKARIAPDVMVVPGIGNDLRRSYFSWEEPTKAPAIVFEMASKNTWREDLTKKKVRYRKLGVPEYIVFDPEAIYLYDEPLIGFELVGNRYVRKKRQTDGSLATQLGFRVRREDRVLRLIDSTTGKPLLLPREKQAEYQRVVEALAHEQRTAALVEAEKQRADAEKLRAEQLAAEVERLKAMLQSQNPNHGNGS